MEWAPRCTGEGKLSMQLAASWLAWMLGGGCHVAWGGPCMHKLLKMRVCVLQPLQPYLACCYTGPQMPHTAMPLHPFHPTAASCRMPASSSSPTNT